MVLQGSAYIDDKVIKFAIDPYDSPFMYRKKLLDEVDVYFKMQCPHAIKKEGFQLNSTVCVPYIDFECNADGTRKLIPDIEIYKHKIKPLMIGARKLACGISKKSLLKGYHNYVNNYNEMNRKKLMCYFGSANGSGIIKNDANLIDFDSEKQIMYHFKDEVNHPNEKRYKAAKIISDLEPVELYDARVINQGCRDETNIGMNPVPIEDFCKHIANFEYNLNISGFRLSIPNRFVESFMVGTAIVTDTLHVKWFLLCEEEVVETVEMGYELDKNVDWDRFHSDIENLPMQSPKCVKFI